MSRSSAPLTNRSTKSGSIRSATLVNAEIVRQKGKLGEIVADAYADMLVVDGDPTKSGPFTIHVMMPSHYRIAPHSHPTDETITVLRGTFRYGMGDKWDTKAMHALPHGGSGTMKAGENHYAATTGRTEISIQSTGPFEINYVNPKDDPRNKKGNKPKV